MKPKVGKVVEFQVSLKVFWVHGSIPQGASFEALITLCFILGTVHNQRRLIFLILGTPGYLKLTQIAFLNRPTSPSELTSIMDGPLWGVQKLC